MVVVPLKKQRGGKFLNPWEDPDQMNLDEVRHAAGRKNKKLNNGHACYKVIPMLGGMIMLIGVMEVITVKCDADFLSVVSDLSDCALLREGKRPNHPLLAHSKQYFHMPFPI